jgi:DNA-binding MarR family transcriptional regulator
MELSMKMPAAPDPLSPPLGHLLRSVSDHISHAFCRKLAKWEVNSAEWAILRDLHRYDSVIPSALATRLGMTRGTISKLVDRLTTKGLVTRTVNETDRRYQVLALTMHGRALVFRLSGLAEGNDDEFFGHLKPGQREMLETIMRNIVQRQGLEAAPSGRRTRERGSPDEPLRKSPAGKTAAQTC